MRRELLLWPPVTAALALPLLGAAPLPQGSSGLQAGHRGHTRPAVRSAGYGWVCSAVMLSPKARPFWVTGSHRGSGGTLDKFKAAGEGRLAHDGSLPKILGSNLVPAAVADRRIGLQPDGPGGRGWLVCNLASTTDRHRVLHAVNARTAERATCSLRGSPAVSRKSGLCPCPTPRSIDGARYRVIKAP